MQQCLLTTMITYILPDRHNYTNLNRYHINILLAHARSVTENSELTYEPLILFYALENTY